MSEYYGFTKYTDLGEIKHVETSIVNGYLISVAWYSYPYIDNKEFHFENVFDLLFIISFIDLPIWSKAGTSHFDNNIFDSF